MSDERKVSDLFVEYMSYYTQARVLLCRIPQGRKACLTSSPRAGTTRVAKACRQAYENLLHELPRRKTESLHINVTGEYHAVQTEQRGLLIGRPRGSWERLGAESALG